MASTGSVVAIKYDKGVLMASDTLVAYGKMAKMPNVPRTTIIGQHTAVAASGDYADYQAMTKGLIDAIEEDEMLADGHVMQPKNVFSLLHRTVYSKRCDYKPALCEWVVIGSSAKGEPFIGGVDSIGTKWTDDCVASGFGAHYGVPLLRRAIEAKQGVPLTRAEAKDVLKDCLRTLFYRECSAINRVQFTDAADGKVTTEEAEMLDTQWEYGGFAFEKTAILK
jgi:20S proteasome subunit beta 7